MLRGQFCISIAKFRRDRSNRCGDIAIPDGCRRHLGFSKILNFNCLSGAWPVCIILLNFIKIGRTVADKWWFNGFFYRVMLCIRGTSHGPVSVRPSVCLSVTSRSSTKTAKRSITQRTPHDSPGSLVFWCQRSPLHTGVIPYEGAECRWGGSKSATFDKYPAISRKR